MPSTESLLNDYLDDRLDPAERRRLESALEVDPGLARSLRALTEIHDLVSALPRDASIDVASRVLGRIAAGGPRSSLGRRPLSRSGVVAASLAATVLILVGFALRQGRVRPGGPPRASNHAPIVAALESPSSQAVEPRATPPAPKPAARLVSDSNSRSLSIVRRFIDNPTLHRVFSVTGSGDMDRRIASVVAQSTRYSYLRLSITQGIVIDPRHPDQASVYAVVVSDVDLDLLRERLRSAAGDDMIEESEVDPAVAVQLADVTAAQAFRPNPRADVRIPEGSLALRVESPETNLGSAVDEDESVVESDQPTPEQFRSAPVVANSEPGGQESSPTPSSGPAETTRGARPAGTPIPLDVPSPVGGSATRPLKVVLVWVSRSARGG